MDIYYLEVDNIRVKSFSTFELAFKFSTTYDKTDSVVKIYHEEYIDEFHGSETSCRVYLLYISEKIN
jgi:hypothetical protein